MTAAPAGGMLAASATSARTRIRPEAPMTRSLRFTFVDAGLSGLVDLHEALAPRTCAAMWKAFAKPRRMLAFHAMFAGPEIMVGLPKEAQVFDPRRLPGENQTVTPAAGDVLWFYQGPHMMKGLPDEFWEVGMFYDDGGRTLGPLGWTPVTIFGRMRASDLPRFAEGCRAIRLKGAQRLEIARAK